MPSGADESDDRLRLAAYAVVVLAAFWLLDHLREGMLAVVPGFGALYRQGRGYLANVVWKGLQVPLVLAAAMALRRTGPRQAARELGFTRAPWRGLAFALLATLPAAAVFLATGGLRQEIDPAYLVMTALASPVSEEVLYRGFLVGQLWLRARWPFWLAALVSAVPFGLSHLYQADDIGHGLLGAAGIVAFTGLGSALFAWLLVRWDWDLWVAVAYHALANLWFYVFEAGPSPLAGGGAFAGTLLGAVGMVVVTVWWTGGWRVRRSAAYAFSVTTAVP